MFSLKIYFKFNFHFVGSTGGHSACLHSAGAGVYPNRAAFALQPRENAGRWTRCVRPGGYFRWSRIDVTEPRRRMPFWLRFRLLLREPPKLYCETAAKTNVDDIKIDEIMIKVLALKHTQTQTIAHWNQGQTVWATEYLRQIKTKQTKIALHCRFTIFTVLWEYLPKSASNGNETILEEILYFYTVFLQIHVVSSGNNQ